MNANVAAIVVVVFGAVFLLLNKADNAGVPMPPYAPGVEVKNPIGPWFDKTVGPHIVKVMPDNPSTKPSGSSAPVAPVIPQGTKVLPSHAAGQPRGKILAHPYRTARESYVEIEHTWDGEVMTVKNTANDHTYQLPTGTRVKIFPKPMKNPQNGTFRVTYGSGADIQVVDYIVNYDTESCTPLK